MILLVGAPEAQREQFSRLLEKEWGYDLQMVQSGKDLIDQIRAKNAEMILLNMDLRDDRGIYLLSKLREYVSAVDMPIIGLTNSTKPLRLAEFLNRGANDVVTLSGGSDLLKARLKNWLNLSRQIRELLIIDHTTLIRHRPPEDGADVTRTINLSEIDTAEDGRGDVTQTIRHIYEKDDKQQAIPCEFPLMLVVHNRSYFSKSIWVSRNNLMVLAFEILPEEKNYRLEIIAPKGDPLGITVEETSRKETEGREPGALKIGLNIVDAPSQFDGLLVLLDKAYRDHGVSGLKAVLRGETLDDNRSRMLSATGGVRYRYEGLLGKGGFASVYLVRDLSLKRSVAMKVLHRDFSSVSESRDNFLSEAQIAAQFHHSNIVFVYEVSELEENDYKRYLDFPQEVLKHHPERFNYFTMQFVDGPTLREWNADKTKKNRKTILKILSGIAKAMAYAHSKGVIHRDIKPDNIMITEDSHVLVADFGIASLDNTEWEVGNRENAISCTPQYASPEQITGRELDQRSDIYSFGVVMYEMLAGRLPFQSKSLPELMTMHLNHPPIPLKRLLPNTDPRLENIAMRCLEKSPDGRFQDSQELFEALEDLAGPKAARQMSKEETLELLIMEAQSAEDERESAENIRKITGYLHTYKAYDDVAFIKQVKDILIKPRVFQTIIQKNLNKANLRLLYDFFRELDSSKVVFGLLMMFKKEKEEWKKLAIARFALISSGRNLFPLVLFGLDLPDEEASVMLEAFRDMAYRNQEPIFLKWAEHTGPITQGKLLSMLYSLNRSEAETLEILKLFSSGTGSDHPNVKQKAAEMLSEY